MAWGQAWHLKPKALRVLGLLWTVLSITACTALAESVRGCPEGPQGSAVAEAAAAAQADSSTPALFQKQVLQALFMSQLWSMCLWAKQIIILTRRPRMHSTIRSMIPPRSGIVIGLSVVWVEQHAPDS